MEKFKELWRLPFFILVWSINILIKIPVVIGGLFIIPILYLYRHREFEDVPNVLLAWQNPEDWKGRHRGTAESLPQWWINEPVSEIGITIFGKEVVFRKAREHRGFGFWSWYKYHAIRNPANGLRNFEALDLDIEPSKVHFITSGDTYLDRYEPVSMRQNRMKFAGYLAWQGWRAGTKIVYVWNEERHLVFKFGWRLEPRDKYVPIDPNGTRVDDAGFATKFLPYREG